MSEKTPQSIRRIVAARARGYCEYCRFSDDFATESLTVRATVEALRLNRFGVVNLRRLLRSSNLHPPEDLNQLLSAT
jgi:hypothetical protein